MIKSKSIEEHGWAALELALVAVVLLSVVMIGAALADYIGTGMTVQTMLERHVLDSDVRPLQLVQTESGPVVLLNHTGLEQYLTRMLSALVSAAQAQRSDGVTQDYLIEASIYSIAIDPLSGEIIGDPLELSTRRAGSLVLSPEDDARTNLLSNVRNFAEYHSNQSAMPSLLALPHAGLSAAGATTRFFGTTVVVSVRVFVSTAGSWVGRLLQEIGSHAEIGATSVVLLRGELGS